MTEDGTGHPPLRRNWRYQLLWTGGAISAIGTSASSLALPLLVIATTGSPTLAGLATACRLGAMVLFAVPAGVLVDRWDRRRILVNGHLVLLACFVVLGTLVATDRVALWHLVVITAIAGVADAFVNPARTTAIRGVVPASQLPTAFAQEEARTHAANLAGNPVGGFLYQLGRAVPFFFDAVTYLVSLVCVLFARVPRRPPAESGAGDRPAAAGAEAPARPRMTQDVAEAARWLWGQHGLRAVLTFAFAVNLFANAFFIPVIVLVSERGGTAANTGLVMSGIGIGGIVGALVAGRLGRVAAPGVLLLTVVAYLGAMTAATTLPFGSFWPFVPLMLGFVALPAVNVVLNVLIALLVPQRMLGRLDAFMNAASIALVPLAPVLGGFLAESLGGAGATLVVAAAFLACSALGALSRNIRRLSVTPTKEKEEPKQAAPDTVRLTPA